MLMSISIPYTCIQLHNNQYKWTKKLECMLKHHLTQFDKTLTLKLYIKIAYNMNKYSTPPPLSIIKTNKKAILQRHGKCFKTTHHVCKTKPIHRSKTWNMINDIAHPYGRRRRKISHYIKKKLMKRQHSVWWKNTTRVKPENNGKVDSIHIV